MIEIERMNTRMIRKMLSPFLEPGPGGCLKYISQIALGHKAASVL